MIGALWYSDKIIPCDASLAAIVICHNFLMIRKLIFIIAIDPYS